MAAEVVAIQGRQAQVIRRNGHSGANSFGSVQVKFLDTGEIKNLPDTVLPRAVYEDEAELSLPLQDQERLDADEEVIARGLSTFIEVGNALLDIRDNRLYRARYTNFEDYCRERWSFSRRQADRLIGASEVVSNLGTIGLEIPANEFQARPLTGLDPEDQRVIWQLVVETAPAGKVTAAHVKSVVNILKDVGITGAIDNGDGEDIPIEQATSVHVKAAVTEETYERMQRQTEHIAGKSKWKPLFNETGALETIVRQFDWMQYERQTAGRNVRLMLHVEADDAG